MRAIKKIHQAIDATSGGLITYRALPTPSLNYLDPFLFLNHHGLQHFPPGNNGLPFGPHPHRGIETVTFIVKGELIHKDNAGFESRITAGGIQWMTAGSGLLHAETSSETFKELGGDIDILQLWINLPAKYKMIKPNYIGLQKEDIPSITKDNGRIKINLIAGNQEDHTGPVQSVSDVWMSTIEMKSGASLSLSVPEERNIFLYVAEGRLNINQSEASSRQLVEFDPSGSEININAEENSMLIFAHAKPFNEPVISHGPFVMNTQEEIQQAYQDYRSGKFGNWKT